LVRAWGTSLVDLDLGPKDTEHRARSPAPLGSSHISWSCRNSLEVSPIGGRSPFSFCASIFSAAKFGFWLHLFCRRNSYPRQGFCFCVDSRSARQLILLSWPGSRWECLFSAPNSCLHFCSQIFATARNSLVRNLVSASFWLLISARAQDFNQGAGYASCSGGRCLVVVMSCSSMLIA
jgi:hypothetical protein